MAKRKAQEAQWMGDWQQQVENQCHHNKSKNI